MIEIGELTNLWVPSGEALLRLALAAQANGVSYVHGISGQAIKLLYDDSDRCIGVLSGDGTAHLADVVLVAAGAQTGALIDVENELVARSMCVATIQLTPEEVKKYENLPMVTHFEEGKGYPFSILPAREFLTTFGRNNLPSK